MNTPVNFELAKLLKEKGFDESTEANWWILAKDHQFNYVKGLPVDESKIFFAKNSYDLELKTQIDEERKHNVYHVLSAPTIAEVVMWLYEKHGIWIYVKRSCEIANEEAFDKFTPVIEFIPQIKPDVEVKSNFNSPTEAYEAAILYVLNNLLSV